MSHLGPNVNQPGWRVWLNMGWRRDQTIWFCSTGGPTSLYHIPYTWVHFRLSNPADFSVNQTVTTVPQHLKIHGAFVKCSCSWSHKSLNNSFVRNYNVILWSTGRFQTEFVTAGGGLDYLPLFLIHIESNWNCRGPCCVPTPVFNPIVLSENSYCSGQIHNKDMTTFIKLTDRKTFGEVLNMKSDLFDESWTFSKNSVLHTTSISYLYEGLFHITVSMCT